MSVTRVARAAVRRLGIDIHKYPSDRHLTFDYPVSKEPRYGHKTPPHPAMLDLLERSNGQFELILAGIAARRDLLAGIEKMATTESLSPFWDNGWFPSLDACVLMHLLLKDRPRRYTEIGSGNSTIFAHHAKQFGNLATTITSIDPQPRAGIDRLCDQVIRRGLQDTDLVMFDALRAGDILFFDGSHRVFSDSDVTVFFLEVLPRIKPGVMVHIHDIFWPQDYPKEWGQRYYSEQYMLAMLLLYAPNKYEILFASAYISTQKKAEVAALTPGSPVCGVYGTSFWLTVR